MEHPEIHGSVGGETKEMEEIKAKKKKKAHTFALWNENWSGVSCECKLENPDSSSNETFLFSLLGQGVGKSNLSEA